MSARPRDRAATPGLTGEEYLQRWSALHEGIDPSGVRFVRGWLAIAYRTGRPLAAARVPPTAITVAGLLVAAGAAALCFAGSWWLALAAGLVVLSGLMDSLDGTVAVLSSRISASGALADAICDRLADAAYGVALWAVGSPAWLAGGWVALGWLAEYVRVRGHVLLGSSIDVVTVGERPTRIVLTTFTLVFAAVLVGHASVVATVGAAAAAGTALVGLVQIVVAVRRRLG